MPKKKKTFGSMSHGPFTGTCPCWWPWDKSIPSKWPTAISAAKRSFPTKPAANHATRSTIPIPYGNPLWSQFIYFQLLECGLRIPPSAGSGSGVAPNPVGYNRMYVHVDGDFTYEKWWQSFRAGQVVITNGPLMRPTVDGELPGHVFQAEAGGTFDFEIGLTLSTRDPISYLEIIKNGQVAESIRFDEYAKSGKLPNLHFDKSGWFLLRAITDVGKTYRFAMTAPYYVEIGYKPRISKKAAQFFLDWVYERAKQIHLDDPQQQREANRPAPQGPRLLAGNALQGQRRIVVSLNWGYNIFCGCYCIYPSPRVAARGLCGFNNPTPNGKQMPQDLELLAPAGDWAALEAALDAGADAVYFGLRNPKRPPPGKKFLAPTSSSRPSKRSMPAAQRPI